MIWCSLNLLFRIEASSRHSHSETSSFQWQSFKGRLHVLPTKLVGDNRIGHTERRKQPVLCPITEQRKQKNTAAQRKIQKLDDVYVITSSSA